MKNLVVWVCVSMLVLVSPCSTMAIGRQAKAVASVLQGLISEISVTDGGSGYRSAPRVSISGGGGLGASAVAILEGDTVRRIIVTNAGTAYHDAPTVTLDPPFDASLEKLWEFSLSDLGANSGSVRLCYFGADGSALGYYQGDLGDSAVWSTGNGVSRIGGYHDIAARFVSADKAIFTAQGNGSGPFIVTLTRLEKTNVLIRELDLTLPHPLSGVSLVGGLNDIDLYMPASRRDCFLVKLTDAAVQPGVRYVAYRLIDPDLFPVLAIEGNAAPKEAFVVSVKNASGADLSIEGSGNLKQWTNMMYIPSAPSVLGIKIRNHISTNHFLRAVER